MTSPSTTGQPPGHDQYDQQALTFEKALEAAAVGALLAWLAATIAAAGPHLDIGDLRRWLTDRLRRAPVHATRAAGARIGEGLRLGAGRAAADADLTRLPAQLHLDDATNEAVAGLDATIRAGLEHAARLAAHATLDSASDVTTVVAPALKAANQAGAATRWAANRAVNLGTAAVADATGGELVWLAERNACLVCLALSGTMPGPDGLFDASLTFGTKPMPLFPLDDPQPLDHPPRHPNCLPGDALVLSRSRITGATTRVFDGEMVTVRTLDNQLFRATPNHPVLTNRGWVAVGLLREGDYVVRDLRVQGKLGRDDNNDDVPARIEEIAQAFLGAGEVSPLEVPLTAEDFHGDGAGSEVAVVGTNRSLLGKRQAAFGEKASEQNLPLAHAMLGLLSGDSPTALALKGVFPATPTRVGKRRQSFTFGGRCLRHPYSHRLPAPAWLDAGLDQVATDDRTGDGKALAQRLLTLTGDVALDQVISVERDAFHGRVFNLETEGGWYIGNGIVTHNCRCRTRVWLPGSDPRWIDALKREAQRSVARGWSDYDSQPGRLTAADRLLRHPTLLAPTVRERARRAVKSGAFPT